MKLMAGLMLFLGWREALEGIFLGLVAVVVWHLTKRGPADREFPLVPWFAGGILSASLLRSFLFFFGTKIQFIFCKTYVILNINKIGHEIF